MYFQGSVLLKPLEGDPHEHEPLYITCPKRLICLTSPSFDVPSRGPPPQQLLSKMDEALADGGLDRFTAGASEGSSQKDASLTVSHCTYPNGSYDNWSAQPGGLTAMAKVQSSCMPGAGWCLGSLLDPISTLDCSQSFQHHKCDRVEPVLKAKGISNS